MMSVTLMVVLLSDNGLWQMRPHLVSYIFTGLLLGPCGKCVELVSHRAAW